MTTPLQQSLDVALFLDSDSAPCAANLASLSAAGVTCRTSHSIEDFCVELINPDVFCAIIPEEALAGGAQQLIRQVLQLQPTWSDVPLFILGSVIGGNSIEGLSSDLPKALYCSSPVSDQTLLSLVQLAQRYRGRQTELRELAEPPSSEAPAAGLAVDDAVDTGEARSTVRPIQVMLVDDHEIVLKGLRGVMAFFKDIEVVGEARSGLEAVSKAKELQPQVIIMDVNMPMGNGIEVTRAIKSAFPAITIIGLSVYNDSAIVNSMREAGADAFFEKGIDENVIHAAIQAHTQRTVGQALEN
ncbi:MAG: response regulator transcription factor [Candidatus Hydrogenedentales bacterium]